MKRIFPFLLILSLCSCAKVDTGAFSEYRNKDLLVFANVTQICEDYESEFYVRYEGNGDAGVVTILEPESIAGISARIEDGKVYFNDTALLTEEPSPLCAVANVLKAWQKEPLEYGREGENAVLVFENMQCRFSSDAPISAEILRDNREVLRIGFVKSEVKQ